MNFSNINNTNIYSNYSNSYQNYDEMQYSKFQEDRYRKNNKNDQTHAVLAMKGITTRGINCEETEDELSKIFFSEKNMARIQRHLKREAFKRTRGQFRLDEDQDESDLLVVMRSVFLEHARFLPFRLVYQIKELNKRTIEAIIPDMITQIKQSYGYIKEINEPIKPIDRPINVNNAGRKTLPSLTSAWGF
jgi:Lon protease-like protein